MDLACLRIVARAGMEAKLCSYRGMILRGSPVYSAVPSRKEPLVFAWKAKSLVRFSVDSRFAFTRVPTHPPTHLNPKNHPNATATPRPLLTSPSQPPSTYSPHSTPALPFAAQPRSSIYHAPLVPLPAPQNPFLPSSPSPPHLPNLTSPLFPPLSPRAPPPL